MPSVHGVIIHLKEVPAIQGVCCMEFPLYHKILEKYPKEPLFIRKKQLLKTQWLEEGNNVTPVFLNVH